MQLRVKWIRPMGLSDTLRPAVELDASNTANQRLEDKN